MAEEKTGEPKARLLEIVSEFIRFSEQTIINCQRVGSRLERLGDDLAGLRSTDQARSDDECQMSRPKGSLK